MSAGGFQIALYQAQYGDGTAVHRIQIQPETLGLTIAGQANTAPAGPPTSPISARVSGGRKQIGLNANLVRIKFTEAVPPGYLEDGIITLPLLNDAIRGVAFRGAVGTYLALDIEVVGTTPETVR